MKKWLKGVAGLLLTIGMVCVVLHFLGKLVRPLDTDVCFTSIDAFHALPEDSVDVLVLGSSHAWRGFDTRVLQEEYGINAYNYACNWQSISTANLFFHDALRTQNPKVVLLETYNMHIVLEDVSLGGELFYTRQIPMSPTKIRYLITAFGTNLDAYASYFIPLYAFHDNWLQIGEWNWEYSRDVSLFQQTRGFMDIPSSQEIWPEGWNYKEAEQYGLSDAAVELLDEIADTCKEEGIQFILFTTPMAEEWHHYEAMQSYAENRGIPYYNFYDLMDEIGFDVHTDFSDDDHLNTSGARKVAKYIGDRLQSE